MRRRKGRQAERTEAIDETIPLLVAAEPEPAQEVRPTLWQRIRVVLLAFSVFLCLLVVSGAVGVYTGAREGEAARLTVNSEAAQEHYLRGVDHLTAGAYELAMAEFRLALQLHPGDALAAQGLAEAEVRLAARPTPTFQPQEDIAADLYEQGVAAFEAEDWEASIAALAQLRAFAPEHEIESVEDMLFTSLYNFGLSLLAEDSLEEGIFYLDQAQAMRPLDEGALWERDLAHRYLTAVGYWAVDWERAIERFEEIYALAPAYRDVFSRLYDAHVLFGDLWVEQGEMCPATEQYDAALELVDDPALRGRRDEAAAVCAVATPTPIPPITGTLLTTDTVAVLGFPVGRLAYPAYDPVRGQYDVYAVLSDGTDGWLARVAVGGDQPSWQWGSDRLIYRQPYPNGLALTQPGGEPLILREDPRAAWPTISPDGGRYAYAAQDESGVWRIYIARTDGEGEPRPHAAGWGPAWGPTGLLAWTGCEADGVTCGIFVDSPDDESLPVRLTSSRNDSGIHWAPGGDALAYMSDHNGSWDIYLLSVAGDVRAFIDDPAIEALPAWAPDGSRLAFLSYRDGLWGVYLVDATGEGLRQIIDLGAEMPNWRSQRLSWAP